MIGVGAQIGPLKEEPEVELPLKGDDVEEIFILGKEIRIILWKCENERLDGRVFFKKQRVVKSRNEN